MNNKAGYVAIIGRPNVGKSTLLNLLVEEKLAGVSPKPQTTRGVVRGILTRREGQIVFLDTPGLHEPHDLLGGWMMGEIKKSLDGADLVYWLVLPGEADRYEDKIFALLGEVRVPVFLVVNQIDRFAKQEILPVLDHYHKRFSFRELIPISARTGLQVDLLLAKTFEALPESPNYFPADQISDQHERDIAVEMIREKIFRLTEQEVPYGATVVIEKFEERSERLTDIHAVILVEKDSQKAILIGSGGQMMKRIGQYAREDLEKLLNRKVYLKLWVRTAGRWKDDAKTLKDLGYC